MARLGSFVLSIAVVILSVFLLTIQAADQIIKNANGTILYEVIDGQHIRIPNGHRTGAPRLEFTIHPPVVDTIKAKNSGSAWDVKLNDGSSVEIFLEEKKDASEFTWHWHGGGPNGERDVCFNYGYGGASWYAGYQSMNSTWPLATDKVEAKQQFNFLMDYDRFNSREGGKETILVLEHLFINTDGFAVALDPQQPLFISRNPNRGDAQLCFTVANIQPYSVVNHAPDYLDIKFKIFISTNIRAVTEYVNGKSGFIPKPTQLPDESVFRRPTWFLWEMNHYERQIAVEQFLNQTIQHGFAEENSQIILDFWESAYGNYTFAPNRYPKPDDLLSSLQTHHFKVGVPLYGPFLNDETATKNQFYIKIKGKTSNIIDFSNPTAAKYYTDRLKALLGPKKIDTLHLFPHFSLGTDFTVTNSSLQNYPSMLTTKYLEAANQIGKKIITEFAFKSQHLPIWTRLTNHYRESVGQELREIVADVLAVSIAGYSFIIPYSAGGFFTGFKPSEEEFIRLVQATTLMPAMSFTRPPWLYSDQAINITKAMLKLHADHSGTILELAKKRLTDGSPIIRPLWYSSPDDAKTYHIADQYLLGDDILVAPVLAVGQRERDVYFPSGIWIDESGKSFTGPGSVKVAAPLEVLPYFKRKR